MSTVVYQDGFRIMIRTREKNHKSLPHCHVVGQGHEARIHLETLEILTNTGFDISDMRKIIKTVQSYQDALIEKWKEYHDEV